MSKKNQRNYDKAVGDAIEHHKQRRCSVFLEEAVGHTFETLGPAKTKKMLMTYIELVDEFE